jgi:transcriptional regulator with XRE-family HTH domain
MEIGEKIKRLRTAKLMTQADLVGEEITRNMLSRIENGAAQPSLSTVLYIAQRLNVSPGFLLADEEDELLYFKAQEKDNIKRAYNGKNYELCMQMCENSEWSESDDEMMLIRADCSFRVGVEHFCAGNLHSAAECFDSAVECCKTTSYDTSMIATRCRAYFEYMKLISPTLYYGSEEEKREVVILGDTFCNYSGIFCDGEEYGFSNIPYLAQRISAFGDNSPYLIHVNARLMMEGGDYEGARKLLHQLLVDGDYIVPEPMLYFIFGDIEICCKESDDFKGAYEYSVSKISLSQKLLSC